MGLPSETESCSFRPVQLLLLPTELNFHLYIIHNQFLGWESVGVGQNSGMEILVTKEEPWK